MKWNTEMNLVEGVVERIARWADLQSALLFFLFTSKVSGVNLRRLVLPIP